MIFAFSLAYGLNISDPESLQQKKEELALQHEVTVVLKLVQVFVVDEKGNPVTDLSIDDFILYDNQELKTITDFEKHLLSNPLGGRIRIL